jgi:hypothetical protein
MDEMGKPEGKSSLGRPRCRREDSIKMDLMKDDRAGTELLTGLG